jgi:DNA (cytosine-5)-methyltransferase 1
MPEPLRIGSLCSGYGGLDLAALAVFGGEVAWHAEVDPAAAGVLACRFPGVPNLGDITALDRSAVPPVDVLTAGYPCQPESLAGQRKGESDERWIWPAVATAIRVLRPRVVLLENVSGHVSLGLRAVLGDLARLRLDAEWCVLAASELGAAHQRKRLFVLAWPADPTGNGRVQGSLPALAPAAAGQPRHPHRPPAADPARLGEREPADQADTVTAGRVARPVAGSRGLLPTPCASDGVKSGPNQHRGPDRPALAAVVQPHRWGAYAAAITRHEQFTGRPAPRFTEWLMGLPEGWVTAVPDITRADQLRLLGNGVIPAQAEAACRHLAGRAV